MTDGTTCVHCGCGTDASAPHPLLCALCAKAGRRVLAPRVPGDDADDDLIDDLTGRALDATGAEWWGVDAVMGWTDLSRSMLRRYELVGIMPPHDRRDADGRPEWRAARILAWQRERETRAGLSL